MGTRVLIVDDHRMVRQLLRTLLEQQAGTRVVAEAENGREAVLKAKAERPDVVIMDVSMPEMNGIEATRRLTAECPEVKVIALSMSFEPRFVREMMEAGACGYVLKGAAFQDVVRALRASLSNQTYFSPEVAERARTGYPAQVRREGGLSDREREVVQLVSEGKTSREIAWILHVSVKTVEAHRQHVMKKLGVRSVPELTRYAIREGLTSL